MSFLHKSIKKLSKLAKSKGNKMTSNDVKLINLVNKKSQKTGINYQLIDKYNELIKVEGYSQLKLNIKAFTPNEEKIENSVLATINFLDANRNKLMGSETFPINKRVGSYQYVSIGSLNNVATTEILVDVNVKNVEFVELNILNWKKGNLNFIETPIKKTNSSDKGQQTRVTVGNPISNYITQLKKSDRLIILYTTAPYIGHPTLELRPNRLAKEYLALGYKVIFFSFSRVPAELVTPGEYPHLLQCFKDDLFSVLTQLSEWEGKERIFICSSFPDIFAMTAIEKLKMEQHWRTIYEIRDDMEEFNRVGYSKWYSSQLEINVAQLVDKVVTVSPRLAQKIKVMASLKDSNKVKVIQNAAPNQLIKKSEHLRTPLFFDIKNQSKKIGYIGHLTPSWFDWTLLINTAKKYSDWQFEIIGHGMPKNLVLPKNICFLGSKTHDEFLEISKYWKVGLIPFIKSPLTSGVDPNKIYEYLSANLLVVTANMGSVKECPATFVYDENEQFENMLKQAMSTEFNQLLLNEINEYVEKSRWSDRAKSMIEFIKN